MMLNPSFRRTVPWPPFLKHQADFFRYRPGIDHEKTTDPEDPFYQIEVGAFLGGWGSGKSAGVMRKAIHLSTLNGWRPEYENTTPLGVMVAPTHKILKQATLTEFFRLCPKELILKDRGAPHNDIVLANGFRWLKHSGESEIEGITAALVVIDEIHHPTFSNNPRRFLNLLARCRDPFARRRAMLVAGLPESGWVEDTFGGEPKPGHHTVLAATRDNPFIPTDLLEAFLDACPSGHEENLLGGRWMAPSGSIYVQFSADKHLLDKRGDSRKPVSLSLDVGNFGCVLVSQPIPIKLRNIVGQESSGEGVLVCDQILTSNLSVEQMAYKVKTETDWILDPRSSVITTDPTIRRDEINALRRHFGDVRIVKRDKGHQYYPVESGIRVAQRALRDALGNVRCYFSKHLASVPLGIIEGLGRYRRNERTGEPIKDNLRDHPLDAWRYKMCELLPPSRPRSRVI